MKPLTQHLTEIQSNEKVWNEKPLIREIYGDFYARILARIDASIPGAVIELGSGLGALKTHFPQAYSTDLFPNPWLDVSCDAYRLPFRDSSASNLVLFDVFHHLERPFAFLADARRCLAAGGRLLLFEPYISLSSLAAYGVFHHEPVAWTRAIDASIDPPPDHRYYAAQGNASRLYFRKSPPPDGFRILSVEAFSSFAYLFSGGLSKPAFYPTALLPRIRRIDSALSRFPRLFGARCLIVLQKEDGNGAG